MTLADAKQGLLAWYASNKRELPWRANRDPYRIWISEVMLQQTTTTAVIPYFERFVRRFPNLKTLAEAPVEHVLEAWAGLGYYSRARNLHKTAQAVHTLGGFPKTHSELMELPGFGPYTSRSLASLAFDENVGVVDGNVIRVLARIYARDWDWWQVKVRDQIQELADTWVKQVSAYEMNQALMELGRTLCTPKSPSCLLCPTRGFCQAFGQGRASDFPKPKPRRDREIWIWSPVIEIRKNQIRLAKNARIPFLKNQWMLPGEARKVPRKPKTYDYKHTVTHHDIYVTLAREVPKLESGESKWVKLDEIRQHVPASLVQKALAKMPGGVAGRQRVHKRQS